MPVHRTTVINSNVVTSQVGIVRLLEIIFTCVTFSLVVHRGGWHSHHAGDWCMFCWCFCFSVSVLIVLVELFGLQNRVPVSWKNFPITFAMFATLLCLSASVIYPIFFLNTGVQPYREIRDYRIAATVFSCLAFIAYTIEVSMTRAKPGEVTGYMATVPGLLKVVEGFTACIIFVLISEPVSYASHDALKWCLAVYCICFILCILVIILCVGECTGWLPFAFDKFLSAYALLAVLMYASATIIWPIFKFDKNHGGQDRRPDYCKNRVLCDWDKLIGIAVLTAFNLIIYIADLVYSARLIFIRVP
ncbi:myeloid-associated differentiation marker homolog [Protopterus annectens]|uniref:myeloid-associated differentiation marker homolog n=1 Tax=Protopterus annectens TaxID=7888 RepID=UPI001CFB6B5C|nr:myeloid-associated differentiation marker homolog [Protopterus annectens]